MIFKCDMQLHFFPKLEPCLNQVMGHHKTNLFLTLSSGLEHCFHDVSAGSDFIHYSLLESQRQAFCSWSEGWQIGAVRLHSCKCIIGLLVQGEYWFYLTQPIQYTIINGNRNEWSPILQLVSKLMTHLTVFGEFSSIPNLGKTSPPPPAQCWPDTKWP